MEGITLKVPDITCGHCVMAIKREPNEIEGVSKAVGDSEKKQITVEWGPPAALDQVRAALREISYPAGE